MILNFTTGPLFLAALISIGLAIAAWRRRPASGVTAFALLMLAVAEWCIGSAMELASPDLAVKFFWTKIQYLGIVAVPACWLIFILCYTGRFSRFKPGLPAGLAFEPVIVVILAWTNQWHHLIWGTLRLTAGRHYNLLIPTYHYGFWIHMIYSYLVILAGTVFLLIALVRFSHLYQGQIALLLLAGLAPLFGNIFYLFNIFPFKTFDLTPFAFTISGLAFSWGFSFLQFLQIAPVARDLIIESMNEAVFVLDFTNRVIDINPAALRLMDIEKQLVLGKPVSQALAQWGDLVRHFLNIPEADEEIAITNATATATGAEPEPRFFEVRVSPLRQGNRSLGRVVLIHEITAKKKADTLQNNLGKLHKTIDDTVQIVAQIVEIRDPYTAGHQKRVAKLACAIAEEMGYPAERVYAIRMAALCHDVGKIGIPVEILNKPGRLTDIEFRMMQTHAARGYEILKGIEFSRPIAQMVLQHHERLNGSGYPQGLQGTEILTEAKILGVADVVEAMTNDRPYRPALGVAAALAEIVNRRGVFFEPEVVDACLRLFQEKGYCFEVDTATSL